MAAISHWVFNIFQCFAEYLMKFSSPFPLILTQSTWTLRPFFWHLVFKMFFTVFKMFVFIEVKFQSTTERTILWEREIPIMLARFVLRNYLFFYFIYEFYIFIIHIKIVLRYIFKNKFITTPAIFLFFFPFQHSASLCHPD